MKNATKAIENYIFGKDGNRPDLLRHAFSPDATLTMLVQTSTIQFPPTSRGAKILLKYWYAALACNMRTFIHSASVPLQSPKHMLIGANGWLACQQKQLESCA